MGDYQYSITPRVSGIERSTKETSISVRANIDGWGDAEINTGLPFVDHLIIAIAKHSMVDITLRANSNDGILHHLIEDISIALSQSLDKALHDRSRIRRFGHAVIPMDESVASVTIDLIKRQFCIVNLDLTSDAVEGIPCEDLQHFVKSFVQNLNACTHVVVKCGDNDHHKIEAAIKAFAVAFRMAASIDERRKDGIPSTKGAM